MLMSDLPRQSVQRGGFGLTARIREELKKGPATVDELAERLETTPIKVRNMVQQLVNHTGGVIVVKDTKPPQYALYQSKGQADVPSKLVNRGYRYGWGKLG